MKPIVRVLIRNTNSAIESSIKAEGIVKQFEKALSGKEFASIIDSPIQLYMTIIVNPNETDLEGSYQQNGKVYIKALSELDNDRDIYTLKFRLSRIEFDDVKTALIVISLKDFSNNDNNLNEQNNNLSKIKYEATDPQWDFKEIILKDEVRAKIERATKIIKNKDLIFNTLGYSRADKTVKSIICLYGPAGTGKTITAQAIAKELEKKIVFSSYAQIESKYVGDGAKNLRKIFEDATSQDAVLFMDECDSFLSKRIESTDSGSDKHYNRMSNELFQLLENHSGCIIFATNLLTDIDKAFKSRIIDSIYFPLPDKEGRMKILKKMCLPSIIDKVFCEEKELENFAEQLDGFSGRDMRKSLLLSFAEVSDEIAEIGLDDYCWPIEKFKIGFDDVRKSFSEDTETESIPLNDIQTLIDKKRFCKKQFELAKHAVLVDSGVDDREYLLMQDLSKQLMNVELEDRNIKTEMSLSEICNGINDISQKRTLIDIAIRVVSVDGEFSERERTFIRKLCKLLSFSNDEIEKFICYAESMGIANLRWIEAIKIE